MSHILGCRTTKTAAFVELGKRECPHARTETHRKEACVVDGGDEGRAMKARKPLGGMSCDVTHGRGLKARTARGRFKLRTASAEGATRRIRRIKICAPLPQKLSTRVIMSDHTTQRPATPKHSQKRRTALLFTVYNTSTYVHTSCTSCTNLPLLHSSPCLFWIQALQCD